MVDVQYFQRFAADSIEDFIGITPERDDANAGTVRRRAHALRPARDVGNDEPETPFDGFADAGIVGLQPNGNLIDVVQRGVGIDLSLIHISEPTRRTPIS